jgi:hypothetical protein
MNIVVKKTNELSIIEQFQIAELFNQVFLKNESVVDFFSKYYWTTSEGSYHSMMKINDNVVGCYSVIPYEYSFFDRDVIFGLSVDTMIDEKFRGSPFNLKKMAIAVYDKLIMDGVSFVFGFPNENVYLVRKKVLKWEDIGSMDLYILPIKVGQLKHRFQFANRISEALSALVVLYTRAISSNPVKQLGCKVEMNTSNSEYFFSRRYDKNYKVINDEIGYVAYRTYFEGSALVAYVVDVYPLEQGRLERSVNLIYQDEKDLAAIIYVGKLPFRPRNMIKVPQKYIPKSIRMSGLILNKSKVDDRVFDVDNWQVSLASYDVR